MLYQCPIYMLRSFSRKTPAKLQHLWSLPARRNGILLRTPHENWHSRPRIFEGCPIQCRVIAQAQIPWPNSHLLKEKLHGKLVEWPQPKWKNTWTCHVYKLDFRVSGCFRALTTQPQEKGLQFQFSNMFQLEKIVMLTSHLNNKSLHIGSCQLTKISCVDPSLHDFNWGHSAGHPTDTEPSDTRWRHGFQHRVVLVKLMNNKLALAKAYWKWTSQKLLFVEMFCWVVLVESIFVLISHFHVNTHSYTLLYVFANFTAN